MSLGLAIALVGGFSAALSTIFVSTVLALTIFALTISAAAVFASTVAGAGHTLGPTRCAPVNLRRRRPQRSLRRQATRLNLQGRLASA